MDKESSESFRGGVTSGTPDTAAKHTTGNASRPRYVKLDRGAMIDEPVCDL